MAGFSSRAIGLVLEREGRDLLFKLGCSIVLELVDGTLLDAQLGFPGADSHAPSIGWVNILLGVRIISSLEFASTFGARSLIRKVVAVFLKLLWIAHVLIK